MSFLLRVVCAGAILALSSGCLYSQGLTGQISGSVQEQSGAVVAGADVVAA